LYDFSLAGNCFPSPQLVGTPVHGFERNCLFHFAGGLLCYSEDMSSDSLPMLGHMTEAGAGDYPQNFKRVDASKDVDALRATQSVYQFAEQQNPQAIDLPQECGSPPKTYNATTQIRSNASRADVDTFTLHHSRTSPVSKHGKLHNF
jgi:hypothetical protein